MRDKDEVAELSGQLHPSGGPDPGTCGALDSGDHIWQAVLHCNQGKSGCAALQTNAIDYVFDGTNSHNFITVPEERVNGIECPWICEASAPNYWQDAWNWAQKTPTKVDTPVGLGINSKLNRNNDQLHIHMAEVRTQPQTDLRDQDTAAATDFAGWPKSRVLITGYSAEKKQYIQHLYRVLILQTFSTTNLFTRLRDMVTQPEMEYQTLIVIPRSSGKGGYYIVNSQLTLRDKAHSNLDGSDTCDPLLQLA